MSLQYQPFYGAPRQQGAYGGWGYQAPASFAPAPYPQPYYSAPMATAPTPPSVPLSAAATGGYPVATTSSSAPVYRSRRTSVDRRPAPQYFGYATPAAPAYPRETTYRVRQEYVSPAMGYSGQPRSSRSRGGVSARLSGGLVTAPSVEGAMPQEMAQAIVDAPPGTTVRFSTPVQTKVYVLRPDERDQYIEEGRTVVSTVRHDAVPGVQPYQFSGNGRQVEVLVERELSNLGGMVWDAGKALCHYFVAMLPENYFVGKRVLELGSGTGIGGLVAAALGAEVVVTDLKEMMPLLERNVALNADQLSGRISAARLFWGPEGDRALNSLGAFDIIIGCDVTYASVDLLAHTLRHAVFDSKRAGKEGLVILAHTLRWRGTEKNFDAEMGGTFREEVVMRCRINDDYRVTKVVNLVEGY